MKTNDDNLARGEVYSLAEVARAAGLPPRQASNALAERGLTVSGSYLSEDDAVRLVKVLSGRAALDKRDRAPLTLMRDTPRRNSVPLAASGALHAGFLAAIIFITAIGWLNANDTEELVTEAPRPVKLVYLISPGPGGGGGGGGMKSPLPPPPAQREAPKPEPILSPIPPVRRPPASQRTPPKRPDPPVQIRPAPKPAVTPPPMPDAAVFAPVRSVPSDALSSVGQLDLEAPPGPPSNGPGESGGVGSGRGTGIGEGSGDGIGPGSGGGTGGGPYQPGSGISPPTLIREVRPLYTDDARRRGIEGDVALQIVVRRDGSVGQVKVVRSLGSGLDQRAVDAVRQWKFGPATRQGQTVDVLVDVSVAFTLR